MQIQKYNKLTRILNLTKKNNIIESEIKYRLTLTLRSINQLNR